MIYMGDAYKGLEDDSMGTCGYLGVSGHTGSDTAKRSREAEN